MKTAKTIFVTALLVVGALFTSCNKDDDDPSIIGTWKTTSSIEEHFKDGVSQGKDSNSINANNYSILTINDGGTFSVTTMYSDDEPSTGNGTYTIKDNVLTLNFEGDDSYPSSFTLTDNTLVLIYTEEYTEGEINHKDVTTDTYTRQ